MVFKIRDLPLLPLQYPSPARIKYIGKQPTTPRSNLFMCTPFSAFQSPSDVLPWPSLSLAVHLFHLISSRILLCCIGRKCFIENTCPHARTYFYSRKPLLVLGAHLFAFDETLVYIWMCWAGRQPGRRLAFYMQRPSMRWIGNERSRKRKCNLSVLDFERENPENCKLNRCSTSLPPAQF